MRSDRVHLRDSGTTEDLLAADLGKFRRQEMRLVETRIRDFPLLLRGPFFARLAVTDGALTLLLPWFRLFRSGSSVPRRSSRRETVHLLLKATRHCLVRFFTFPFRLLCYSREGTCWRGFGKFGRLFLFHSVEVRELGFRRFRVRRFDRLDLVLQRETMATGGKVSRRPEEVRLEETKRGCSQRRWSWSIDRSPSCVT